MSVRASVCLGPSKILRLMAHVFIFNAIRHFHHHSSLKIYNRIKMHQNKQYR